MKLDDIAKMAIDEVNAELEKIEALSKQDIRQDSLIETKIATSESEILSSEEIFLKNLKERVEVLFEGLNETPKQLIEDRLELTLKFLEFVLASVEDRLKNISK